MGRKTFRGDSPPLEKRGAQSAFRASPPYCLLEGPARQAHHTRRTSAESGHDKDARPHDAGFSEPEHNGRRSHKEPAAKKDRNFAARLKPEQPADSPKQRIQRPAARHARNNHRRGKQQPGENRQKQKSFDAGMPTPGCLALCIAPIAWFTLSCSQNFPSGQQRGRL